MATAVLAASTIALSPLPVQAAAAPIQAVPVTTAHTLSTVYSLRVNGISVPVNGYAGYDYAEFAMGAGTAQIAVTKLDGSSVSKSYITPIKDGHLATHSGSVSTFTI